MKPLKQFLQPGGDILEDFGPEDVRTLLRAEEELCQVCLYFQIISNDSVACVQKS